MVVGVPPVGDGVSDAPANQTTSVTMVALPIAAPGGPLAAGVHLRWMFDPSLGFPTYGFDIFRRLHRPGVLRSADLSGLIEGALGRRAFIDPFTWSNVLGVTAQVISVSTQQGSMVGIQPGDFASTVRLDSLEAPVRLILIDVVHWVADTPMTLTVWGISGERRVTHASVDLSPANQGQLLTLVLKSDALDGFQVFHPQTPLYAVTGLRWVRCSSESEGDWGDPLNAQRIGLPVTAPGYAVPTPYGPDPGDGHLDWQAAADRLSPTGSHVDLPPALAQRFGPPVFDDTRDLMQRALAGQEIQTAAVASAPALSVDAVQLLLLAATDADFARLLGLAMADASAVVGGIFGERYDYKVVGYWAGPDQFSLDCAYLPSAGAVTAGQDISVLTVPSGSSWQFRVEHGREADDEGHLSATFNLDKPVDTVRISAAAGGDQPLRVAALAGDAVVAESEGPAGVTNHIMLNGGGITSVIISGRELRVDGVCHVVADVPPITYEWICFDIGLDVVPDLPPPQQLSATLAPGFVHGAGSEQVITLTVEPRPVDPLPWELFPLVRVALDAVEYDLERRADGDAPSGVDGGAWVALPLDDRGEPAPMLRNTFRPDLHQSPEGWQVSLADFIDGTLDPNVRFYSYRARAHDLFGRISAWSAVLSVDAADHVAPPTPAFVRARWIELGDPRATIDDVALLQARELPNAVRTRWSWPGNLRRQAPDTASFRVYWNAAEFTSIAGTIVQVDSFGSEHLVTVVTQALITPPSANAFAGDWLRQRGHHYLVDISWEVLPLRLRVIGVDVEPPVTGDCTLTLRGPDAQRLDLLGNPLQIDASRAEVWEERVEQGPLVTISTDTQRQVDGVEVTVEQVTQDRPRPGTTIVQLKSDWRWSEVDPTTFHLSTDQGDYPIVGGTLGTEVAVIVVDTSHNQAPMPGAAALFSANQAVSTLVTNLRPEDLPDAHPFMVLGGTAILTPPAPDSVEDASLDQTEVPVIAHRVGDVLELAIFPGLPAAGFEWFPDCEAILANRNLPIDEFHPTATARVGVSAVDGRAYVADRRPADGEPTGPGNEGAVASDGVQRMLLHGPGNKPAPEGTQGADPLWASAPEPFSGISRYPLRWQSDGAHRFMVEFASLDAVLDAAHADPGLSRGAQDLRQLAIDNPLAFVPLTTTPLVATDALLADPQGPPWFRWIAPLDGRAPGTCFLRVDAVDAAGNHGPPGDVTLPIIVPDTRRPHTPPARRSIDADRAIWIEWDAADSRAIEYWIYRSQSAASALPDVRDMQHIATLVENQCPQPLAVFAGSVRLPGSQPHEIVAVFQADVYEPTQPPDAQPAAPLDGPFVLTANTVSGVDVPDGSLVYVVVRGVDAGPVSLASPPNGRAYRDPAVTPAVPFQYRIEAVRAADVGPNVRMAVHSFPSDVLEGQAFDPHPPDPPVPTLTWRAAQAVVSIDWQTAGLPVGLEVLAQRSVVGSQLWQNVGTWLPATAGEVLDAGVDRHRSYFYRLRARNALGRVSAWEVSVGPVDTV